MHDTQAIYDMISNNAAELRKLHAAVHRTHKLCANGPDAHAEWQTAAESFHRRFDMLSFPRGYEGALDRLLAGDPFTMEAAICFLEVRPFFFRSGYMFKDLLRKARKAPLTAPQHQRLELVEQALTRWRSRKRDPHRNAPTEPKQRVH